MFVVGEEKLISLMSGSRKPWLELRLKRKYCVEYSLPLDEKLETWPWAQIFLHISTDGDKAQRGHLEQNLGFIMSLEQHKLSLEAQSWMERHCHPYQRFFLPHAPLLPICWCGGFHDRMLHSITEQIFYFRGKMSWEVVANVVVVIIRWGHFLWGCNCSGF